MKLLDTVVVTVLWMYLLLINGKCDLVAENQLYLCLDCLEAMPNTCNIPFNSLSFPCKNKIDINESTFSDTNNMKLICKDDNSLTFGWNAYKNAYYFMKYSDEYSNVSLFTNLTQSSFGSINKLIPNQKYAIELYRYIMDSQVLSKSSRLLEYTTKLSAPRISVRQLNYNLKLENDTYTATVTWKPGADLSCIYEILWDRKNGQPGTYYHRKVSIRQQAIPQFNMPNLNFGKKYIFSITSVNKNGDKESGPKVITISIPSCLESYKNMSICPPDTPKNLTFIEYSTNETVSNNLIDGLINLKFSWNSPKYNPNYYIAKLIRKMNLTSNNLTIISLNISGMNNNAVIENIELGINNRMGLTAYSDGGESNSVYINIPHRNNSNNLPNIDNESSTNNIKSIWIWTTFSLGIVLVLLTIVFRDKIGNIIFKHLYLKQRMDDSVVKYVVNHAEDLKWELDETKLTLTKVVGVGAFGVVQKGWYCIEPNKKSEVAVKMLKAKPSEEQITQFYNEIEIMKAVPNHLHIVYLIGVIRKYRPNNPLMLVEFCANGDLQTFLRNVWLILSDSFKNNKYTDTATCSDNCDKFNETALLNKDYVLQSKDLLSFARQIVVGMEFLSSLKMIHRDLATRNILLTENYTIKISDFGLCRDIYTNNVYQKVTSGKLPFRWMALESLTHQVYTTESDVWSFGIVLWEIVTLGGNPFPAIRTEDLISLLEENYRMENPINCSKELYHIMLRCWDGCPSLRPTFKELREIFDKLLESEMQYISVEDVKKLDLNHYENIKNNSIGLAVSKRYMLPINKFFK